VIFLADGFRLKKVTEHYSSRCHIDFVNMRLKADVTSCDNWRQLIMFLEQIANKHHLSKILIISQENQWQDILEWGYQIEAINPYHFSGQPGYYMSKFLSAKRLLQPNFQKEQQVLNKVFNVKKANLKELHSKFTNKVAVEEDIPEMAKLFDDVFATYPTPISEETYLKETIFANHLYMVIKNSKQEIVSAASAELDKKNGCAEITDCATDPTYRGKGLMYHLINGLENALRRRNYISAYSIARANSPGINTIFKKKQYRFCGKLINNCHICGNFENMHLWAKKL